MGDDEPLKTGRLILVVGETVESAVSALAIAQRFDGVRVLASSLAAAASEMFDGMAPSVVVADAREIGLAGLTALRELVNGCQADRVPVIALLTHGQLDEVGAMLVGESCVLLCDPDDAEIAAALAVGLTEAGLGLRESSVDSARRQRIQEEVARFAATLTDIVDRGTAAPDPPDTPPYVADTSAPFGLAEPAINPVEIRRAIRSRRLREDAFDMPGLFEDPAWDMLLDLFAAELEGRQVSVSSLCIAASVAPTTALRWIGKLIDAGLLERRPDAFDRRRAFISLHARASQAMHRYFASLRRTGLTIA